MEARPSELINAHKSRFGHPGAKHIFSPLEIYDLKHRFPREEIYVQVNKWLEFRFGHPEPAKQICSPLEILNSSASDANTRFPTDN